ncbi:MAG: hypothetical protein NT033_00540 [Candidatus Omnitrophica bacterium]|nr:hypothetical protein [Candidatus Omnitrophota bacterium]
MKTITQKMLEKKVASVWGVGYLGYTTILKLQHSGFRVVCFDLNSTQLHRFQNQGASCTNEQEACWSRRGYVPRLDASKITISLNPNELFKASDIHFIAIPESSKDKKRTVAEKLVGYFIRNLKKKGPPPLLIFESAFVPGHIEKHFLTPLRKEGFVCGKHYFLGIWFRTDWMIESFIDNKEAMPAVGYCGKSNEILDEVLRYFDIPFFKFASVREAEIYINAFNAIQAMVNDFVRQLSLGYPAIDMRKVASLLFANVRLDECQLNMGTGGTKMILAIDNLIEGSVNPGSLTLLREFQDLNISSVLAYGEYIIRHGYKSVTILGLTYRGNQKDITLSPSITLADYLIKNSVNVSLHDPLFEEKEIETMVKGARVVRFSKDVFQSDVVIVASDHDEYKYLSQKQLGAFGGKTKLVIDNDGIWSKLNFKNTTRYVQVGDGSLNLFS